MKIAIYDYSLRKSIRSTVCGQANAIELYVKRVIFGEDVINASDKPIAIVDVDPLAEAERISRFLDKDQFESIFGKLSSDWVAFVKKFQYKKPASEKATADKAAE